jgi:hypothetical protein
MSVTTSPGATALMRMFRPAYSIAADLVSEITALFEADGDFPERFHTRPPSPRLSEMTGSRRIAVAWF